MPTIDYGVRRDLRGRAFGSRWWPLCFAVNLPVDLFLIAVRPMWPGGPWGYGLYLVVVFGSVLAALAFTVLNLWGVVLGLVWMGGRRKDHAAGLAIGLANLCAVPLSWVVPAAFANALKCC